MRYHSYWTSADIKLYKNVSNHDGVDVTIDDDDFIILLSLSFYAT